jgi:hypothetical protein
MYRHVDRFTGGDGKASAFELVVMPPCHWQGGRKWAIVQSESCSLRNRATNLCLRLRDKSCCQMRITSHPLRLRVRTTSRSRTLFRSNFSFQKARLFWGKVEWIGQQCQKHPSTKTATLCFTKTKSGLPKILGCRRHPTMRLNRKISARANSVFVLPRLRTRDMIAERLDDENTSTICSSPKTIVHGLRRAMTKCADRISDRLRLSSGYAHWGMVGFRRGAGRGTLGLASERAPGS